MNVSACRRGKQKIPTRMYQFVLEKKYVHGYKIMIIRLWVQKSNQTSSHFRDTSKLKSNDLGIFCKQKISASTINIPYHTVVGYI